MTLRRVLDCVAPFKGPLAAVLFTAFVLLGASCSREGRIAVLEDSVYGFHLGEKKEDLLERINTAVTWTEIEDDPAGCRGEMYELSAAADGSRGIDRVRITFLRGRLMELVVYMKQTNVTQLYNLKTKLESRYGVQASSPGGDTEMAYKTWWIKAPGMSVTLRRITKKPETELYIQYIHERFQELAGGE